MTPLSCLGALLVSTVCLVSLSAVGQRENNRDDANSGRVLYLEHCAGCHGLTAKGDGAAAMTLRSRVPDLTQLAARNGGDFPTDTVARFIDGRQAVAGHVREGMPLWGTVFNRLEAGDERTVRTRIDALVAYVKSLGR